MDASGVAVATILTQQPDDDSEGHQHPVAYDRRKLTVVERNYLYAAHVVELLAVVHALLVLKPFLGR